MYSRCGIFISNSVCAATKLIHLLSPQCVPWNSPNAPSKAALAIIKDYQEIEKVIYPEGKHPLFILQNNDTYTRVVVDRMRDAANVSHDVLFLGTGERKEQNAGRLAFKMLKPCWWGKIQASGIYLLLSFARAKPSAANVSCKCSRASLQSLICTWEAFRTCKQSCVFSFQSTYIEGGF